MRIVVVGLGKVGRVLTAQLVAEEHDLVVIDQNQEIIDTTCAALPETAAAMTCRKKHSKKEPIC